tara:strand:+ start:1088 stop:1912 length:825 start_codon:yes stop_codon:yes gene_type:complete
MNKLLTVLLPTYNNYELFLQVIQNYIHDVRVNILVSDDSDNYIEKNSIEIFCRQNNIKYYEGPKKSAGENFNHLIKMIKTPFFVLNHHDDYPINLDFLDILDSKNIGLIILPCSSKVGKKANHKIFSWQQVIFSKICLLWPNSSFNMILAPTASVIVNSEFKNILFDSKLIWFSDADWYQRLFRTVLKNKKFKVKFFNHSRIYSIQSENSITSKLRDKLKKQIFKEKIYLNKKGFLPNKFLQLIQLLLLATIISLTRLKKFIDDFFILYLFSLK